MFELFDIKLFLELTKNLRFTMIGDSLNTQLFRSITSRLNRFRVKNSDWVKARDENEDYNAEFENGFRIQVGWIGGGKIHPDKNNRFKAQFFFFTILFLFLWKKSKNNV